MQLSEYELAEGLTAVARFLTPIFPELSPREQAELKKTLLPWLAPIFLKLPEGARAAEVRGSVFQYEFLEAAQEFELRQLRKQEIYEWESDEALQVRVVPEKVEVSARHLAELTALALEAIDALPAEVRLASQVQEEPVRLEELQELFEDPAALDSELQRFLE